VLVATVAPWHAPPPQADSGPPHRETGPRPRFEEGARVYISVGAIVLIVILILLVAFVF
jgi:hypothetical protein